MTDYLISVDPGVHQCGVAFWIDGQLVDAQLREAEIPLHRLLSWATWERATVVCEVPQVYLRTSKQAFAADLIDVAFAAGVMCSGFPVRKVLPKDWKKQVPKVIHQARGLVKLPAVDRAVLDRCMDTVPKDLAHNVVDAVLLGRWYLTQHPSQVRKK